MAKHERTTQIVGTSFYPGSGSLVSRLRSGAQLILKRQPENKYDKNAVAVHWGARILGHVPRGVAADIGPLLDAGVDVKVFCATAGPRTWGVIKLTWETTEVENAESNT